MNEMMVLSNGAPQEKRLIFRIIKSASSRQLPLILNNVAGLINFDVAGSLPVDVSAMNTAVNVTVPANAEIIYISLVAKGSTGAIYTQNNSIIEEIVSWGSLDTRISLSMWENRVLTKIPDRPPRNPRVSFQGCSIFNQNINDWDVSHMTIMTQMFNQCTAFNQPLNKWNVSNVTGMANMFSGCSNFNQDISGWDVRKVTGMGTLFGGCTAFNQPLNTWITSSVTDLFAMFQNCPAFNQPLNNWNISKVTRITGMFQNASSFNQNLSNLTFPLVNVSSRSNYDQNATAWLTVNKPNFAIK